MNGRMEGDAPIFVRGLSRSGGTLLVTLLDSHPKIAMSYELYPTLLDTPLTAADLLSLANKIGAARNQKASLKHAPSPRFRTFISRAERGGIDHKTLGEILRSFASEGGNFIDPERRFDLIAACCRYKMRVAKKDFWGLKCNNDYPAYLQAWPRARFINIIRDGRDVMASQLNTGSFKNSPSQVAESWSRTHKRFREFREKYPAQFLEIKYEALTQDLPEVLKKITDFLCIEPDDAMLNHDMQNLTLFQSHHLSKQEVLQPVNTKQIGRWRYDAPQAAIEEFLAVAQDALVEFGYKI